jgi:hypothetical protein
MTVLSRIHRLSLFVQQCIVQRVEDRPEYNPNNCDFIDYEIYRYVRFFHSIDILNGLLCSYPNYLDGSRVRVNLSLMLCRNYTRCL